MLIRELYLSKIRPFYENELIKIIVGIRRCGKSTIMRQISEELKANGVSPQNIIYLNFEDLKYAFIRNEIDLYDYITPLLSTKDKYYLFFDEIQIVNNFEKAINSFRATNDVSIFITGFNSRLLSSELSTLLSGRFVSFRIMPFTFKEVCEYLNITEQNAQRLKLQEYIKWGGMPGRFVLNTDDETRIFLADLYDSIVLRDIIGRSKIRDIDLLNKIVEYLVATPAQLFSAKSISNFMQSENRSLSKETLYNYLHYITASFIMNKVQRYDLKGKKKLETLEKYYLTDIGIGRVKDTEAHINLGAALENIVYNELLVRGYDVYVGKNAQKEVDFLAIKAEQKLYIQVAYLLADEQIIQREFGVFENIKDNFPKYVISMDNWNFSRDGIIHKNILDFLLE